MQVNIKARKSIVFPVLAATAMLLVGLIGSTQRAFAAPSTQADDPVAIVMQFNEAFNNVDLPALEKLLAPSFLDVTTNPPAGIPPELLTVNKRDFIDGLPDAHIHAEGSNCHLTAPDTVECDTTLTGEGLPPLAHPWTERSIFTVADGQIVRLEEVLSDQTVQDLEVFLAAAPGMPTTGAPGGSSSPTLLTLAVALAALSLGLGFSMRRKAEANE